ncbi:dmX-like protein 2 isoform X2 [Eriocheir sinensis]|uniref:dmX-like protein 2 isoform X2 n=1 Tax=Eriocheir sinensis TaxID=95602 RepID=UPI0021C5AF57|nr:dmX-like protein 2 isoform X2 [Eriocheir sinensis]
MKCHQILTGACNAGDRCFAVGSVEGVPFTAYAAGCNIVILASTFERVQVIPGVCHNNIQISCVDCSTDTGKIAAAYGRLVCVFEPTPLTHQLASHRLDYRWVQTGVIEAEGFINTLSWNVEGTRLLTAGDVLQMWAAPIQRYPDDASSGPVTFDLGGYSGDDDSMGGGGAGRDETSWACVWRCLTAAPTAFLSFSPDGTLFATAATADRLVKIWYDNKHVLASARTQDPSQYEGGPYGSASSGVGGGNSVPASYSYIYLPHPSAVRGFTWRATSKYMPKGSVSNMLITSCRDNISRVWVETVLPDDDLVSLTQLDPTAAQNPRFHTHRHKHRFLQRLKHMKACFHMRRLAKTGGGGGLGGFGCAGGSGGGGRDGGGGRPLPTMQSSYSMHDFHMYGFHAMGITPGFQFHLAASINAETDIPLVPSLGGGVGGVGGGVGSVEGEQGFVIHWLNNKEMHFTSEAENILLELCRRALEKEIVAAALDPDRHSENSEARPGYRPPSHLGSGRTRSLDEDEGGSVSTTSNPPPPIPPRPAMSSHQPLSAATSSTSIATDATSAAGAGAGAAGALGDALDRRIEALLRAWHSTSDVLFSIHPVDGSLLVWVVDFLDDYPGSFRQAQVSFSARIPSALPLGDAMTMCPRLALYCGGPPNAPALMRQLARLEGVDEEGTRKTKGGRGGAYDDMGGGGGGSNTPTFTGLATTAMAATPDPSPIISLTTKHSNGTLNLWHLSVAEGSRYTQVLNISHFTRVCGHRFQLNDIKCHPVLPLLLSTSHHNKREASPPPSATSAAPAQMANDETPLICIQDPTYRDWCSELILWRVDAVGPLSRSGGVTELARVNSPHTSAFSNAAWIPTLLPSTTLGSVSNSPSACFVASDGECLRVYQAVIDGRALLAEISTSERKKVMLMESNLSLSTDSSLQEQAGQVNLSDIFNIISEQSTARPGCIIKLDAIGDATNDWKHTQFLHVFQEGLIQGEAALGGDAGRTTKLFDPSHAPMVDLHSTAKFEEPFYITLLEKTSAGSTMHVWRLVIASETQGGREGGLGVDEERGAGSPISGLSTPPAPAPHAPEEAMGMGTLDASPIAITTTKVCEQSLPLPPGVSVLHASPAAGHLSSASIHPACYAPYVLLTACSDNTIRFWSCRVSGGGGGGCGGVRLSWQEWAMVGCGGQSAIKVPGLPLHVSAAYSGRIACAYQTAGQRSVVCANSEGTMDFSCTLAIYECESTGGSQWVLEDKFDLNDTVNQPSDTTTADIDLGYLSRMAAQGRSTTSKLTSTFSSEDLSPSSPLFSADALQSVNTQLLVPSPSTLHCLRNQKFDKSGVRVKQKHPVQIAWVSQEDGSHLLTAAIGSKVVVYTSVAEEVAMVTSGSEKKKDKEGRTTSMATSRPVLQKSMSMHTLSDTKLPRWMRLQRLSLATADGLAPLPMQVSWVRDGILVVGMDNEVHVYTQWHDPVDHTKSHITTTTTPSILPPPEEVQKEEEQDEGEEVDEDMGMARELTEANLKTYLQGSAHHPKGGASGMARVTSYSVLAALDTKMKKGLGEAISGAGASSSGGSGGGSLSGDEAPLSGIFEAGHMASPVLPQYHPRQLMELLNSGKIRRVKAILAHLVRCLSQLGQRGSEAPGRISLSDQDDSRSRVWSRSRTLSVSGTQAGSAGREGGRGSITLLAEELTLDYIEVTAIPPLPLWLLLEADRDTANQQHRHPTYHHRRGSSAAAPNAAKEDAYAELFGGPTLGGDDDDLTLEEEEEMAAGGGRRKSLSHESKGITFFGPRQAQILATLLTHTHLPGLSSLDQMHLLALADTVASCNVDFADRFDINKAKEALAKETFSRTGTDEPSMETLDDCGLRFLLAMRHHTYLLRCLPIAQRAALQKTGIGSHNFVWAFHSESQEELLDFIPSMRQGNPRWSELRELGFGWWVRNNTLLTLCFNKIAKAAFLMRRDPLDAAIYYLAMKKKSLVWGLFRSIDDKRMTDFFSNNFAEERWRKAALKNAFALLGKQRFEHAAAFFLLAGALKDALEVVLNKLQDEQLAIVIIRLYEGEFEAVPPTLRKMLYTRVLGYDETGATELVSLTADDNLATITTSASDPQPCVMRMHPDPFLRSVAFWMLKDYSGSLNTLLRTQVTLGIHHPDYVGGGFRRKMFGSSVSAADPSVFNFYIYLRTHPLLIRQCIANTAKGGGAATLMASRLSAGQQTSVYGSTMTPAERRLYFTTAHAHLTAGCPTLALEVLSKLPHNVTELQEPTTGDLLGSPTKERKPSVGLISSGTLGANTTLADTGLSFDWAAPSSSTFTPRRQEADELDLDFSLGGGDDEEEEEEEAEEEEEEEKGGADDDDGGRPKQLDIMAQQLKFISCLKMMMESLATLATGCEVDGGQLRYQLYVWLEREVEALKEVCDYCSAETQPGALNFNGGLLKELSGDGGGGGAFSDPDVLDPLGAEDGVGGGGAEQPPMAANTPGPPSEPATLHEILQQEKAEFEEKMERAGRRKRWLLANQQLLRTLLSYCSLHGSSGGGLASVRMELILLLQELQQENSKQQLLSPLPFPTTLPLLSASIASNKTVVSDPVRHLQAGTHDLLQTLVELRGLERPRPSVLGEAAVLRNLAAALSACIYQSLCDSETFTVKTQHRVAALGVDIQHLSVAHRESHLVGRDTRGGAATSEEEALVVCTPPAKWPGVTSLLALLARERDEDTPKLSLLLCEAFVAVYLSLLVHGVAASDAYVLYRLVARPVTDRDWATLFGGGVKKQLKVITANVLPSQGSVERESSVAAAAAVAAVGGEKLLSTFSKTRMKINMKLLGQLGFQDPRGASAEGEGKTAYREHFLPPEMSIVSLLMKKPILPPELENIDYDSSGSDDEQEDLEEEEDDDVFKEPKVHTENREHCDPDSYSWCILRLATIRAARQVVASFLEVAGVEMMELPMQSPLLHSILRALDHWIDALVSHLESKRGPPPEYIPGCFAETQVMGPAILKYRALLETHNTPFAHNKRGVKAVQRLWHFLVRQENVQEVFVRYIFGRKRPIQEPATLQSDHDDPNSDVADGMDGSGTGEGGSEGGGESHMDHSEGGGTLSEGVGASHSAPPPPTLEPVRIIHKDQDSITAFCINEVNPGLVAVATVREVQELDISLLLEHPGWLTNECELDVLALNKEPDSVPMSNFLVIQTPLDKNILDSSKLGHEGNLSSSSSINFSGMAPPNMGQTGRGTNVLKELKSAGFPGASNPRFCRFVFERSRLYLKPLLSHRIEGTRRMTSHPVLPLYLVGCQDGSVVVREWHHHTAVARPRPGGTFAKVARVRFNQQGSKFGVVDGDGNLSLYQLGLASTVNKPFYTHQCHNKHGSDFVFVGSSSLIATAGQSSEHRNVALWDTLLPQRKANVVSWSCHESGASSLLYAPHHQLLLSAGKKGSVCIFDIRQRAMLPKIPAHDSAIKCMALDHSEEFFCTGSADGDIKVWGLGVHHNLIYNLSGEHSKSTLFKNLSQGVTQLHLDTSSRLFSCGADGSIKLRQLPERDLSAAHL